MRLLNQTKNTVVADQVWLSRTFFQRIKGLLGRKTLNGQEALVLIPCNAIHTFFMHFPIDVIFADKNNKVVGTLSDLKPNRISRVYWSAVKVIELPAGSLKLTNTQNSDQLQFLN